MAKEQIKKFVQETVKEIRDGLPEGFRIDDKINFDISVITSSKAEGGLDIQIASVGSNIQSKNVHRIQFAIVDEKAQAKAWKAGEEIFTKFFANLAKIDSYEKSIEYQEDLKQNEKSDKR